VDFNLWVIANWNAVFFAAAAGVLLMAGIYAAALCQGDRRWWLLAGLSGGLVLAAQAVQPPLVRMLLLDAAALASVALVWLQDGRAGRLYLAAVLAGSLLVGAGLALSGVLAGSALQPEGLAGKAAVALLLVGFAIKLALVPFYFWLPPLAEHSSAMTAVLVVAVLDMAELGELAALRVEAPWIFTGWQALWLGLALLAMLGGALLALAQKNLRRMLAFSAVDDSGYLLLGIVAGSGLGLGGALLGILSHAVCKFLLFGAVGAAEQGLGRKLTLAEGGLAGRFPLSAAAFLVGALGMVGVPPLLGAAGRWRLYLTGVELGGFPLGLAMALASILALLYYVRAIHRVWLGGPQTETPPPAIPAGHPGLSTVHAPAVAKSAEPLPLAAVFVLVIALLVISGLFLGFGLA
jgi:multicomponent Na+:H+ antiporter subunit D